MSSSPREASPVELDLQWDIALLRCLADARPVGRNKHFRMIQLQGEMHRRMGSWTPVEDIWRKLAELYHLDKLDGRESSSSESLPASPRSLSPRLPSTATMLAGRPDPASPSPNGSPSKPDARARALKSASLSPPPDESGADDETGEEDSDDGKRAKRRLKATGSAAVIDSPHFKRTFDIPYFAGSPHAEGSKQGLQGRRSRRGGVSSGDEDETDEDSGEEDLRRKPKAAGRRPSRGRLSGGLVQLDDMKPRAGTSDRRKRRRSSSVGTPTDGEMGAWQDMIYDPKRTGQVDEPGWPDRASTVQVKQERDSRCGRRDTTAGTEEDDPEDEQGRDEEADRGGEEDRSTEADEEEGDGSDDDEEESESDARPATGKAKPGASARAGKQQRQKGSAVRTSTRAAPRASSTAKRKRAKDEDSSEESEAEERKPRRAKRR